MANAFSIKLHREIDYIKPVLFCKIIFRAVKIVITV